MSISVSQVVKMFGTQTALNGVSFEANKGEVIGFLGPNGAGIFRVTQVKFPFVDLM